MTRARHPHSGLFMSGPVMIGSLATPDNNSNNAYLSMTCPKGPDNNAGNNHRRERDGNREPLSNLSIVIL